MILLSERTVRMTSSLTHTEEFEVMARDTKLGQEENSRDIRDSREALKNFDEAGHRLHRRRSEGGRHPRRQGDAEGREPDDAGREAAARHLRGKGRRRARHLAEGAAGRRRHRRRGPLFNRRGVDKDERALAIERDEIERLAKDRDDEKAILERSFYGQLQEMLMNQIVAGGLKGLKPGTRSSTRCWASTRPASGVRSR